MIRRPVRDGASRLQPGLNATTISKQRARVRNDNCSASVAAIGRLIRSDEPGSPGGAPIGRAALDACPHYGIGGYRGRLR